MMNYNNRTKNRTMEEEEDYDDHHSPERENDNDSVVSFNDAEKKTFAEQQNQQKLNTKIVIAKRENQTIMGLRIFVLFFMTIMALCVAFFIRQYYMNLEYKAFDEAFYHNGNTVFQALDNNLMLTLEMIDSFTVNLVAYATLSGSEWPLVTLPNHCIHVSKILAASKALVVSQYHLVPNEKRELWETYTSQNNQWVEDALDEQVYHGVEIGNFTKGDGTLIEINEIHDKTGIRSTFDRYLPLWQSFPLVPTFSIYNQDGFSMQLQQSVSIALDHHEVVVSDIMLPTVTNSGGNGPDPEIMNSFGLPASTTTSSDVVTDEQQPILQEKSTNWVLDALRPELDPNEHFSELTYPILANAADKSSMKERKNYNTTAVGVFNVRFFWRDHLKDILPPGMNGFIVVLSNGCGKITTYRIDGPEVTFVGVGDRHEMRYENKKLTGYLRDVGSQYSGTSYTGLPFTSRGCQYQMDLYASDDMKAVYLTDNPTTFAYASACIFLFTSIIFIIYDCYVERRQRKVLRKAVESSTILSSLFPANVQERLFPTEKQKKKEACDCPIKNFLKNEKMKLGHPGTTYCTPPIADLFPEATVFFADIAGFTSWSSQREPTQVFVLLETLYGAFDKIADKRSIFKVETIGDCYVAVTGLPEPRKDHGLAMTKFAIECIQMMGVVTHELEERLGAGTKDLELRVGLHSGPVTAGVLRGAKTRFQLFGDTVNTASRMESNGIRNKIHISEATAGLLIKAGKASWINKRDTLIEAKGKGTMQTYWVERTALTSSNTSPTEGYDMTETNGNNADHPFDFPESPPKSGTNNNNGARVVI